ncbi:MAG: DUF1080 domain-containing protein, partial [Dysgonamonadaceae bacterium]
MKTHYSFLLTFIALSSFVLLSCTSATKTKDVSSEWIPLFNENSLDDWTVKITGYEVGDNYANTFRMEDGILKVR